MKHLIKLFILTLSISFTLPITAAFATNNATPPSIVEGINSTSSIIDTIEQAKNDRKGQSFDDFMSTVRDPSKLIAVIMVVIGGFTFLIGFIVTPLKKIGAMILVGVVIGLFFINYGEHIVGFLLAGYEMLIGYS